MVMPAAGAYTEAAQATPVAPAPSPATSSSAAEASSGEASQPSRKTSASYCCARQTQPAPRFLVIGLGNPGSPYTGTRHNIGRDLVEQLQSEWNGFEPLPPVDSSSEPRGGKKGKAKKKAAADEPMPAHVEKMCAARVATVDSQRLQALAAGIAPLKAAAAEAACSVPSCSCTLSGVSTSSDGTPVAPAFAPSCRCRVVLACPDTFMNLSGKSVSALSQHFRIPASRILVLYDDLALPLGAVRIKVRGSSGGQKGMQSILDHMGGERGCGGLVRIRIGIAPPTTVSPHDGTKSKQTHATVFTANSDVAKFVLQKFAVEEQEVLQQVKEKVKQALLHIMLPTPLPAAATSPSAASSSSPPSPPPVSCCCLHSPDSSSDLSHRLQLLMTRLNGSVVAAGEEPSADTDKESRASRKQKARERAAQDKRAEEQAEDTV